MAELPVEGKFHEVDDAEADAVIEASTHMILHSEAIGRVLRNMYGRLEALETENKSKKVKSKRSVAP